MKPRQKKKLKLRLKPRKKPKHVLRQKPKPKPRPSAKPRLRRPASKRPIRLLQPIQKKRPV